MQAPTPEQVTKIQDFFKNTDNEGLLKFLQDNPNLNVNNIKTPGFGDNLYIRLIRANNIQASHPLLIEALRRNPDPFFKNNYGDTALTLASSLYDQVTNPLRLGLPPNHRLAIQARNKYLLAKNYEYKFLARNLLSLMLSGKNGLGQKPNSLSSSSSSSSSSTQLPQRIPLPPNAEDLVGKFLTGESGPMSTMMSKLSVKANRPGVSNGTQGGTRRYKKRKHKSKKSKKTRKSKYYQY